MSPGAVSAVDGTSRSDMDRSESRLLVAALLTTVMLVAEAIGGVVSGSLALLADAGHMLVDASALMLAWFGARMARRPADALRSFGYARFEVLAGFVNALTMFVLVGWIVWEAIERLRTPAPILSGVMLVVAVAGLVVNLVVLRVLGPHHGHDHGGAHGVVESGDGHVHDHGHDDHRSADGLARSHAERSSGLTSTWQPAGGVTSENLNVRGARLHVIGDLLGSLAAIVAALVVRYTGWTIADPILSVLVSALILVSAWRLLRRSAHILLEGVPDGIEIAEVTAVLAGVHPDIRDVHHVHVWMLGSGARMATLHLRMEAAGDRAEAQSRVRSLLQERYGIGHTTIQIDAAPCPDEDCVRAG